MAIATERIGFDEKGMWFSTDNLENLAFVLRSLIHRQFTHLGIDPEPNHVRRYPIEAILGIVVDAIEG